MYPLGVFCYLNGTGEKICPTVIMSLGSISVFSATPLTQVCLEVSPKDEYHEGCERRPLENEVLS